jgi:putative NIF3 family GTP cyclohydrolase 1 type 2
MKSPAVTSVLLIILLSTISVSGQESSLLSVSDITAEIIKHTGSRTIPNTVDVIKAGDPQTKVHGIITTMFGTMDVLRKAVELNCNFIIVHEPLFYNHRDETAQFQNDPVFLEKKRFIDDHNLVIWRFHDYIHSMKPDGIMTGMVQKLGWQDYISHNDISSFVIPETTLAGLLQYLKKVFPEYTFNVVGNPDMKLTKVRLAPGAPGSMIQIQLLEDKDVDVVIGGEVPQWETYEYVRDAVLQGKKKAIIFLGHIPSEEAGMLYCAEWLKGFIKDIPIHFISSGPSYWTYSGE